MEFGASVLGPIFAEFALRLWIVLNAVEEPEDTCILFRARGGLCLRLLFERFLKRAGLESSVVIGDLMVSRLIAARMAILDPATAVSSEIGREFYGGTRLSRMPWRNKLMISKSAGKPLSMRAHLIVCWRRPPRIAAAYSGHRRTECPLSRPPAASLGRAPADHFVRYGALWQHSTMARTRPAAYKMELRLARPQQL